MPKSSRHKSHKQSKHSSKDLLSDSEEDVKVKERINTREVVAASVRVSIDSSHEKRRISSSFQSKEVKDLSYSEEHVSSKVRKDKVERIPGSGDRWKAGGDEENGSKEMEVQKLKLDSEKGLKLRESKGLSDAKSKSSRRHESGVVEDRDVGSALKGKEEENRSGSTRSDSKRKSDKDASRRDGRESRDTKEKERVSDRESKKIVEKKQESEVRVDVGSVTKKRDSLSEDADKDRLVKRGKENSELGVLDKLRYPESEKELEKVIHRKIEGSNDRDRYRENDHTNVPSKGNTVKDGKHKDERYKAGNHRDNIEKDVHHRDDKYREHVGGDGDGTSKRRDDKHRDGGERERRREDRHRDDGDRDFKYRKDDEGVAQSRGDKYREGNERETKHREDKYRDGGKDNRHDTRYYEDGERVVGLKDEKHRVKNDRQKEEKFREDHEKDSELRDGRHGDKFDKEKRVREAKYKDDRSLRDRSGDKSAAINLREDNFSSDILSRKPGIHDNSPSYDDRSRLKGAQGRKRTSDKDDYIDLKPRGFKDQRYDVEKRSASDAIVTNRGRSGSRYADVEGTTTRHRHSPSSSSHATRDQYRLSKQDDLKYNRETAYEERVGHSITSTGDHGDNAAGVTEKNSLSRSNGVIPKDDNVMGEFSAERRMKSDTRISPRHLISPSPTSADRRNYVRSDFRRSDDIEESVQRSSGYPQKEGRGTRDLGSETYMGDEPSIVDENAISVSSPYPRNTNLGSNSRSFSHPFHSPFRSTDRHHNNRRNGDPNMVRVQGGSPWKGGIPNWPSPLANVFMPPFPHGPPPPPVGFHPSMHPFPGMRPSMGLNHHHPFPVPDNARHVGWRTPVYDPRPPPPQLNGWEANDSAIGGGESRFFGNQQHWHHGGPRSSTPVANLELPPGFEKDVHNLEGPKPPSQSNEQAKKDEQTTYPSDEYPDVSQTIDIVKENVPAASEEVPVEETNDGSKMSEKNEKPLCHVYLSMLDVSADLTDPELYSRYKDMVVNVDEKMLSDSEDDKIIYVEVSKPKVGSTVEVSNGSLFPTIGDSLLQKAMALYRKQREGFVMKEKHSPTLAVDDDDDDNKKEALHSSYPTEDLKLEIHPDSIENPQDVNKVDQKSDEPVVDSEMISSEEEKSRGKDENPFSMETAEEFFPGRRAEEGILDVISSEEVKSSGKNEYPVSMETDEEFPPGRRRAEEEILGFTENGSMNVLNVVVVSNTEAKEVVDDDVVMGELKSDESVKISRILHSPQSTH